jgi:hypothetical protein
MAANFRIAIHRNDENLHLQLIGDFDGSSAWELINSLNANRFGISRVFIHTNSLNCVHPFGQGVLHKNLSDFSRRSVSFVFTGDKASELSSETVKNTESKSQDSVWKMNATYENFKNSQPSHSPQPDDGLALVHELP